MAETIRPDICVIGAGTAGMLAAMQAAALGARAVLVDVRGAADSDALGSDALRAGRLPLSALIAAARRAHAVAQAGVFGVRAAPLDIDFGGVRDYVRGVIASRAPNFARERLAGLGVRTLEGGARFKDAATLVVGGDFEIAARRFVIATGSSAALPPIAGLDGAPYLTAETAFDLPACPSHLIVIGAGAVALEFAQAFRRLGAEVTLVDASAPLAQEDSECATVVLDALAREGVRIRTARIIRVEELQSHSKLSIQLRLAGEAGEETIAGSHVLVAGGRWPNVVGLGLDAAGIKFDEHGIAVGKGFKTANKRVYAIGDVAGGEHPPHAADQQASLVVRNALLRVPVRFDPQATAQVAFTDPELARVGLTEAAARRRGHRIRVLRWPYRENDRAHAEGEVRGHIKVVTNARGRILGATIVGAGAGEQIAIWALAMSGGAGIHRLAGIAVPYPTLAEIGKQAATTYFISGLTRPWVRRIIGWLRHFG